MIYFKNQDVIVEEHNYKMKIICNQRKSTPGIFFKLVLKPNEKYKICFNGYKVTKGYVFLWIKNSKKCIEFSKNHALGSKETEIEYFLINRTNIEQTYSIGLLFRYAKRGDYFFLNHYNFKKINDCTNISNILNPKPSKYLYVYYYNGKCRQKNTMWQLSIRDELKYYMDCISLTDLTDKIVKHYDVIVVDYLSVARYNPLESRERYLNKLKNCSKVAIFLHDMHEYTFATGKQTKKYYFTVKNRPYDRPGFGVKTFINFTKKYNIKYLISRCDCKEFDNILLAGKDHITKHYYLSHHIDSRYFRDYKSKKQYDILFYG